MEKGAVLYKSYKIILQNLFPSSSEVKKIFGSDFLIYEALRDNQEFFVLLIHFLSVIQIVFLPCSWLQNWRENSFEGDTFPEMFSHLWKKEKKSGEKISRNYNTLFF